MTPFAAWVLTLMTAVRTQYHEPVAKWADTYEETASAIAAACESSPIPEHGSAYCAALLVDVAFHESRFKPDERHDFDKKTGTWRGFGEWGVQPATAKSLPNCSADDLTVPATGAPCALALIHISFRVCAARKPDERFAWYASGGAACDKALGLSRFRLGEAARLLQKHPAP